MLYLYLSVFICLLFTYSTYLSIKHLVIIRELASFNSPSKQLLQVCVGRCPMLKLNQTSVALMVPKCVNIFTHPISNKLSCSLMSIYIFSKHQILMHFRNDSMQILQLRIQVFCATKNCASSMQEDYYFGRWQAYTVYLFYY